MDAAKLQEAIDYGTTQESASPSACTATAASSARTASRPPTGPAVRELVDGQVGHLDDLRPRDDAAALISPDDPVGSLVPEADAAHGAITMRDLLTMTSGLRWNGFRDYNIFTMPDRVRDALTLEPVNPPGTYFEYAQSAGRAARRGHRARRRARTSRRSPSASCSTASASPPGAWHWVRDHAGHVAGLLRA